MARLRDFALLGLAAILASGCVTQGSQAGGKATGGGSINSTLDPTAKAQFAFTVQCLDATCGASKGSGGYDDKGANPAFPNGVHMKLTGITVGVLGFGFTNTPKCADGLVSYVSADPKVPNGITPQTAHVTICDNSHGSVKLADTFAIHVSSGPFAGYADVGLVQGGQITITLPPAILPIP
jgi:hypothetical protein